MRVLLRSTRTKDYLQARNQWTRERAAARNFGTSGQAILFALEHRLSDLEVVLAFDNPQYDVAIALHQGSLGR